MKDRILIALAAITGLLILWSSAQMIVSLF